MGNKHVTELKRLEQKMEMLESGQMTAASSASSDMFCADNAMCQNMVLSAGTPGSDPVYACPGAKCVSGSCQCGPGCTRDPRTGVCCTRLDQIGGEYFCMENRS